MDRQIGNSYFMGFNDEYDAIYWYELFGLDCAFACCNGFLNALELKMS